MNIKELAEQYACHTETMTGVETEYILDADDLQDLIAVVRQDERKACAEIAKFATMHCIAEAIMRRGESDEHQRTS